MKLVAMVCVVLACARVASAEPVKPEPPVVADGDLNPNTALALSLGGTAVSWALLIASTQMHDIETGGTMAIAGGIGTLVAPSFGHWYAHSYMSWGQGVRGVSLLVASIGFVTAASTIWEEDKDGQELAGVILFGAGSLGYLTGTVYDLCTAGDAARRWNARNHHQLAFVPVVNPALGSYGVALGGRF